MFGIRQAKVIKEDASCPLPLKISFKVEIMEIG
jgi:hypothetical protein